MRVRIGVILCALSVQWLSPFNPLPANADASGVLISELQIADTNSASNEFVELYNPSAQPLDLQGYQLEYHPASATSDCTTGWTAKAKIVTGTIPGHGFYLFSSKDYLATADQIFASGLASAGSIRVLNTGGQVMDALAWGAGTCGSGASAPAPAAGHSLERRPGPDLETGGNAYDTGQNAADFLLRPNPAPQSHAAAAEQPAANYAPSPASAGGTTDPADAAPLELNELFPDPASPQTDAADEYVEVYNPNPFPVGIAGYVIKTGSNLSVKHTLAAGTVPAEGYLALKSATTKIALSNSGSSIALYDSTGHQLGATVTYPKAKTGSTWARADDLWAWTASPTPGAANLMAEPPGTTASAGGSSKTSSKTKASTAKAKTTQAKATKAAAASSKTTDPGAVGTTPGGRWLLFALAGLTIAYVIYEFRYDLQNFYFKLRGHPGRRRPAGPAT